MGKRLLVFLFLTVLGLNTAAAGQEDWPPISDADRALKDCAAQPGAPAVYLLIEQVTDHDAWTFQGFGRIKVLTPAGKDYGNLEIPFSEAWEVKSIKARVAQPDGRVEPYTGPVLEKTLLRVGRVRRVVKTIALPGVDVGSIIDFKFELKFNWKKAATARSLRLERWKPEEGGIPTESRFLAYAVELWDFDSPLYIYKARYTYILRYGQLGLGEAHMKMAFVSYGLPWGPPMVTPGRVELEVESILPRRDEEWMAPEEEDRMGVTFFLCDTRVQDVASYWRLESAGWQTAANEFLHANATVADESHVLTAGAAGPLDKLKALYDRVQRIQNLSYVRDLEPDRKKELKIKANRNTADVIKQNAGLRSDITRTFVALASRAGFKADLVRVVSRDDKFYNENILDLYGQFDTELAVVTVDGREMFFDPATPCCPMGLVHWRATDAPSIRATGPPGEIRKTPLDPPERSRRQARFVLRLDREGGLAGTASVTFTGQEALALRVQNLGADETGVRKSLEEKMAALLPEGAKASLRAAGNMVASEDSLGLEYDVAIPGVATAAGDRTVPLRPTWRDSFRHASRKSSVYFPYLSVDSVEIEITLPEGLTVETLPDPSQAERSFARYSLVMKAEDVAKVRVSRELALGKYRMASNQYPAVKSFFDQVRAADDAQMVLAAGKR
jgi:Domain of Unknown Function with PDB structure (DUF3857)